MKVLYLGFSLLLAFGGASAQGVDHAPFDKLLRANVSNGVVNYPGFQNDPSFKRYIDALAKPGQPDDRAAQLVYYINAYNALAIEGILQGLSPSTLFGRARYFKLKEWPLNGKNITLYDLEHKIIRPLGEPRIHFAIVCASKSCPVLRAEAYAVDRLDRQLDDQTRKFVNDPLRNRFDVDTKTAYLSEIFKWFDEDFKGGGSTQHFIARYLADPVAAKRLATHQLNVEWIDYDWSLNGIPPAR
jgi:Protein of unknown function, DUF547